MSPETELCELVAVDGPAVVLRKQVPIALFNVNPLHVALAAHAQQHASADLV
jgi:hypothetical protein